MNFAEIRRESYDSLFKMSEHVIKIDFGNTEIRISVNAKNIVGIHTIENFASQGRIHHNYFIVEGTYEEKELEQLIYYSEANELIDGTFLRLDLIPAVKKRALEIEQYFSESRKKVVE
jgi:hypothetical protein